MRKLIRGIRRFEREIFPAQTANFRRLALGQHPQALFITCSDSRIVPSLITGSGPGDLFVLRNPGNIVPPHRSPASGAAAAVEYAVRQLEVSDIVVCGHTGCGAIEALADEDLGSRLPEVERWIRYARPAGTVEENVLLQVSNVRTYPAVAERESAGRLQMHAWIYDMGNGRVRIYDSATGKFQESGRKRSRAARTLTAEGY
jgi:carbonic anhydrase